MIQQLRTPAGTRLQDIIEEIALRVRESIKREIDGMEAPPQTLQVLAEKLAQIISPYLIAFAQCGKFEVCTEGVEQPNAKGDDRIFILVLPGDFRALVNEITGEMLQQTRELLDHDAAAALDQRLRAAMIRDLGKYMFTNPICGYHEVCRRSVPVDPWR